MKLLIAGSRSISVTPAFIQGVLLELGFIDWNEMEIVHGAAPGIDDSADIFADTWKLRKKIFPYKSELGKAGGPSRNVDMGKYVDEGIVIWDGLSSGSKHMRDTMIKMGKPVYEIILKVHNI